MSFSAGVAVTHYKTPLSFVLNEARKAEKRAKSKDAGGRNAIAVTVLKRSGEVHQSHLKWYDVENNYLLDDFEVIVEALNTKTSSNKFITAFSEEFSPIVTEKSFGRDNKELIKIELSRLLKDNNLSKDKEQNSVLRLMDYFISDRGRLQDFIYLLNIADFISREIGELQKPAELCQ
jgi:CRISPR-associated protein Cmr2